MFSCSFLEGDGFFNTVENEVKVANADKMMVYIRHSSIKYGKTTPADATTYQIKNSVPFSVTAIINEEYGFYRWAAFSTYDFDTSKQHLSMVYTNDEEYNETYGAKELDSSVVSFENPQSETTKVYVKETRDDVWIMPIIAVRPTINEKFPDGDETVRNAKLRVIFSKPMDEESFADNYIISQGTRAADWSLNEVDITDRFQIEFSEKKNVVTFSFKDDEDKFSPGVTAKIYFTEDITDSTGYKMEGSSLSRTLTWKIGSSVDNLAPKIMRMTAGINSDCMTYQSTPTAAAKSADSTLTNSLYTNSILSQRVKDKVNIYVWAMDIAKATDEGNESDVLMLGFRAKSLIDSSGKALNSETEGNYIAAATSTYTAQENYSEIEGSFAQATGNATAGCVYTYDLSSLPDGLIQIDVYAYDGTGNDGLSGYTPSIDTDDGVGNGPRSLFVVKDSQAPDAAEEIKKVKSSSESAPFGWYNALSINTVEVYDEAANPIVDLGHEKLRSKHDDIKWVFNLGEGTEWTLPASDSSWLSIKDHYNISSANVEKDGPVSITVRIMDDMGNISDAVPISSVLYDNTSPATEQAVCSDASGSPTLSATSENTLPDSQRVKLPFTEELCGVKIIGVKVTAPDGNPVSDPFTQASISYVDDESGEESAVSFSSDNTLLDSLRTIYSGTTIFTDENQYLHILGNTYSSGTFYIKKLSLGSQDGIYTVTVTLYDAALNRAAERTVNFSYDTHAPIIDRVVVEDTVSRMVYGSEDVTYWLQRPAYDDEKDAKHVTLTVTATENGSGVKSIVLGKNAHITSETTVSKDGTVLEGCTLDTSSDTITFSDYQNPQLIAQSGSVTFTISNISLDNPDSADGNKISVTLKDFVDNSGSNKNASDATKFDLYIDDTSVTPVNAIYSDKTAPQIIATSSYSPKIADGDADSATDETEYASARDSQSYTDNPEVCLTLKISSDSDGKGSGVNKITLTNGKFSSDSASPTQIFVNESTTALSESEYEFSSDKTSVTFTNKVFVNSDSFKFTNVHLLSNGSETLSDGEYDISVGVKDFTGWSSVSAVSTQKILLDTTEPVFRNTTEAASTWLSLEEGSVAGVTKSEVISNLAMLIPFEETGSGVKILHVQPVLDGESTSYSSPFSNTGFT
ncbi:MAG: hypothetical protein II821_05730, partial [Treponema sp.]|nr:hypothetical protein [Treponema sp.]